jgi:hypothetical protein
LLFHIILVAGPARKATLPQTCAELTESAMPIVSSVRFSQSRER